MNNNLNSNQAELPVWQPSQEESQDNRPQTSIGFRIGHVDSSSESSLSGMDVFDDEDDSIKLKGRRHHSSQMENSGTGFTTASEKEEEKTYVPSDAG